VCNRFKKIIIFSSVSFAFYNLKQQYEGSTIAIVTFRLDCHNSSTDGDVYLKLDLGVDSTCT